MENTERLPLISIIVPVYNVEGYLKKCLNSICDQTYKNLEIIIVDDGSTDCSGKICDDYTRKDKRIRVIHQVNGGLSAARNKGLDVATGEYIGFVDGDDWIDNDMYEFLYYLLSQHKADISICSHYVEKGNATKVKYASNAVQEMSSKEAIQLLAEDKVIRNYAWDKLFKRSLFAQLRFPLNRYFEDIAVMYLVFYEASKVILKGCPKYHYLYRDNSIMRSRYNPEKEYHLFLAVYEQNHFVLQNQLWHKTPVFVVQRGLHLIDHIMLVYQTLDVELIMKDVLSKMHEYDKSVSWRQIGLFYALKRKIIYSNLPLYRSAYCFFRNIFKSRRHRFEVI